MFYVAVVQPRAEHSQSACFADNRTLVSAAVMFHAAIGFFPVGSAEVFVSLHHVNGFNHFVFIPRDAAKREIFQPKVKVSFFQE